MSDAVHAFLAVGLTRECRADLGGVQQALRDLVKASSAALHTVPRRALSLPLHDLGLLAPEAFEAVGLAVARVARAHSGFSLDFDQVGGFPDADHPLQVHATVADPKGRLGALHAALGESLAGYGFSVDARRFVPHVPVARISQPGPTVGALAPPASPLRVRAVDLMLRDERLGWRLHQSWALPRFVEEAGTPLVTDPETLAALLDERLAARAKTQKRAPRRRKRSPSTGDRP